MNAWETLGIDATTDIALIKKAYARNLKIHHPEDDPSGFQSLREAYDFALINAEFLKYAAEQKLKSLASEEEVDFKGEGTFDFYEIETAFVERGYEPEAKRSYVYPTQEQNSSLMSANYEIIERAEQLYNDFEKRLELENWAELLYSDAMWYAENRAQLENMLYTFLSNHYYLPRYVWKLFDQVLSIREQARYLKNVYGADFVAYALKTLSETFPLNYANIKNASGINYDEYIALKEEIKRLLEIIQTTIAKDCIKKAKAIFPDDVDFFRFEGIIQYHESSYKKALSLFDKAIDLNPSDYESLYYRAEIYYNKRRYEESLEDINKVLLFAPQHQKSIILKAKCCMKLKDFLMAWEVILEAASNDPDDLETKTVTKEIQSKAKWTLRKNLVKKPKEFKQTLSQIDKFRNKLTEAQKASLKKSIIKKIAFVPLVFFCFFFITVIGLMFPAIISLLPILVVMISLKLKQ